MGLDFSVPVYLGEVALRGTYSDTFSYQNPEIQGYDFAVRIEDCTSGAIVPSKVVYRYKSQYFSKDWFSEEDGKEYRVCVFFPHNDRQPKNLKDANLYAIQLEDDDGIYCYNSCHEINDSEYPEVELPAIHVN